MNLESRVGRRDFCQAVGLGFVAAAVGLPLLNLENTRRVIRALFIKTVDCRNGKEPQNPQYLADAIVVPGTGVGEIDGKMRLEAAGIAYAQNLAPLIILLNGKKAAEEDGLAEKTYLQGFFKKLTAGVATIPDEAILIENHSINTATNMEELAKIAASHNLGTTLIVTNRYHELRSTLFACANEVAAFSVNAESLVIGQDPTRSQEIEEFYKTKGVKLTETKEGLELVWAFWDPKGAVPTLLRRMVR